MKKIAFMLLMTSFMFFQSLFSQCQRPNCPRCSRQIIYAQPSSYDSRWRQYCYWRRYCLAQRAWYDTMSYPSYRNWPLWNQLTRYY